MDKRRSLLYALGALQFSNLEATLHEIAEIVLLYALATKNIELAFPFSSLNSSTRSIFWDIVSNMKPPSMGDCAPWCDLPPLFSNRIERLCWAFARCHFCFAAATDRLQVASLTEGKRATILACRRHTLGTHSLKTIFKDGSVVGSTNLFESDAELQTVSHNLKTAQVRTTRISRQKWIKTKWGRFTGSRAAIRSVPFPNGGGERVAVPPRWKATKDVIVDVTEFLVSVRVGGLAQLDFNLALPTTKAEKLMAMTSTQIISCILTKRSLPGNPRGALLTALKFFPVMDDAPKSRRKPSAPWCIPTKICEHSFGKMVSGRLLSCSLCAST
jgi:hypothetical protein